MTELDTLISRVRELKGPDREVDALIAQAFGDVYGLHGYADEEVEIARRYTASLDATVSLIDRELPGYSWECGNTGPYGAEFGFVGVDDEAAQIGNTIPLALLLAALTAIKERDA